MANVSSNNLTTLYSGGGVNVRPTSAYGNANVVSLLNAGTDGGNTITNIVATGNMIIDNITANSNVTADYFIGNFVGNATNANYANFAGTAFNVSGSNVTGDVAGANHANIADVANSVNVANVVGIGNIAVINLDGNVSNILHGNGYWGPESGNLNANYANFAGNVTNSAQPNITSVGTLVNVSVTGNITSLSGVFVGNGAGLTNINGGNVSIVANANYAAYAGNVTIAGQSNITSLGTLTGLSSNGIVDFANASNVNLGSNSNIHISGGAANYALVTDGAGNLSWGQVANAISSNFANYAGNVTNSAQPNITSVGTLSNLSVSGNITSGNANLGNLAKANFFQGDGYLISNLTVAGGTQIVNGNSNVTVLANSNVTFGINGVANVVVVSDSGANITGNLIVSNNASNTRSPLLNISPAGNTVGVAASPVSFATYVDYGTQSSNVNPMNFTFIKARGNSASLLPANNNDSVARLSFNVYNGNTYPRIGLITVTSPNAATYSNSSITWTGGVINLTTGNPGGNVISSTTATTQNLIQIDQYGRYSVLPGGPGACVSASFTNFGTNSDGSGGGITFNINRSRGNRDSLSTSVATGDIVGGFQFNAATGGVNGVSGRVYNQVNTAYGAISTTSTWMPADTFVSAASNSQEYITTFRGNGQVDFPGNIVSSNANLGNLVVANYFSGNGSLLTGINTSIIANGTSNVSIPVANGPIEFSVNGNSKVANLDGNGSLFLLPKQGGFNNALRIDNFGRSGNTGASRIASFRYRGTSTSPLSVEPNDGTMELLTLGYNGTGLATSSIAAIRGVVGSSYTANGANIPIGWQIQVNDTNGGINNQSKTHNFYSNGNTDLSGTLTVNGGSLVVSSSTSGPGNVTVLGDGTTNSSFYLANVGFSVNWSNVDTSTGFSPFRFDQITSLSNQVGVVRSFRARGTSFSNIAAVTAGDYVSQQDYGVYGDSGNTYLSIGGSSVIVTGNDGAGNVPANLSINSGSGLGLSSSNIIFNTGNTYFNSSIIATGNANIGNLKLNQFEESVYSIGSTSGTITPDFNNGSIQSLTLTGSITLNSLANAIAGRSMTLILTQGGSGGYTLTSSMKFSNGYKTLSSGVGAVDIISVFYDGSTYYSSLTTGYV